jgi:hypothetical protein
MPVIADLFLPEKFLTYTAEAPKVKQTQVDTTFSATEARLRNPDSNISVRGPQPDDTTQHSYRVPGNTLCGLRTCIP